MAKHRLAGEERARAIIEAAVGLFGKRGFSGVTSREIARAARVSEALIFKHFPRKDSLYRAILETKILEAELSMPLDEHLAEFGDEDLLVHIAGGVMRRVAEDDTFLRLLLHSALEGHPLAREFRRARIDRVKAVVERRIRLRKARRGRRGAVDPKLAARVFTGMIFASLLSRHVWKEPVISRTPIDRWARTLTRIFLRGVDAAGEKA